MTKELFRSFSGFATETFFSAAPIRWGGYAAKVRLMPDQRSRRVAPPTDLPTDLAGDMADRLREGPVTYALQAQFFVSEEVTPIENGRVDWPEEVAEFVTMARKVAYYASQRHRHATGS